MPILSSLQMLLISAAVSVLLGFGAGWSVNGWRLNSTVSEAKAERATLTSKIESERADAADKIRAAERKHGLALADLSSALHEARVKNEVYESDRDAAISAGRQRVYVRARCPSGNGLSEAAATTEGNNAASPELDPAYRRTLSELRRNAKSAAEQIGALQQYVSACAALAQSQ